MDFGECNSSRNNMVFGRLLKFWRSVHEVTQEDLALEIESSTRHITRLENGAARPTESMIYRIAEFYPLQRREVNNLLLAAGYASTSSEINLHAPHNAQQLHEILRLLRALDPYPTVVVGRTGEMLLINKAWAGLLRNHSDSPFAASSSNLLDFLLSCRSIQPDDSNWLDRIGVMLLAMRQSLIYFGDPDIEAAFESLMKSPHLPKGWEKKATQSPSGLPFITNLLVDGVPREFFSQSQPISFSSALSFKPVPDMIMMTLFPIDDDLDLSQLLDPPISHKLLNY